LAVLTELNNGLRAGDVWVPGSRQFKDFEAYLVGRERFAKLQDAQALPVWNASKKLSFSAIAGPIFLGHSLFSRT
jgi:hypothetical protein